MSKVTIRTKAISKGRHSIYLDHYPPGHRSIKTTEVYAKIVDGMKRKAFRKIVLNLEPSGFY